MAKFTPTSPLRSFNDFLCNSDRFQIPQLGYGSVWKRRVKANLTYYQINYSFIFFVSFLVVGISNSGQGIVGAVRAHMFGYFISAIVIFIHAFLRLRKVTSKLTVILDCYEHYPFIDSHLYGVELDKALDTECEAYEKPATEEELARFRRRFFPTPKKR